MLTQHPSIQRSISANRLPAIFALLVLMCSSWACNSGPSAPPLVAAEIVSQPNNETSRVGQTATFSVTASGAAPIRYQWSENGTPISGATSDVYTTPFVSAADGADTFSVTDSNSLASITSSTVSLAVEPRAAQTGHWRFAGLDLPATRVGIVTNILSFLINTYPGGLGSPSELGLGAGYTCGSASPYDCAWRFFVSNLPSGVTGLTSGYQSDSISNLQSDLESISTPNYVITALDIQPSNRVFAISWMQTASNRGFVPTVQSVAPADFQSMAMQLGEQGSVITAVS